MRVWMLGSGSRGNAVVVEAAGTRILVDAGFAPQITIDRIDEVQGEISEGLKMLNDLTSAIHLQLSLLQRPSTAVEAAE